MIKNELNKELRKTQFRAIRMERFLIKKMMEEQQINEQLKMTNQMKWVGLMNNIKNSATEIVMNKVVYK
jgi:hypothetical protein